ncbi:MAG TPA: hypothetical protein VGE74_04475 [Gemmata sp.]
MTRLLCLPLALAFACTPALAAEPVVSGTPVGKRPGPYSFLVATGPQRGQQTCYICEQHDGNKPAAVVFARSTSDPLGALVTKLDAEALGKKASGCKVWVTLLADKADLDALAQWAQKQGIKNAPVGAFEDADGPPSYKLHKDADVTVILFTKQKVVANFTFRAGELDDKAIEKVVKAMAPLFEAK